MPDNTAYHSFCVFVFRAVTQVHCNINKRVTPYQIPMRWDRDERTALMPPLFISPSSFP